MEYNKIVSVTGLPGLFELVSSKTDGAVVRSLEDKSTKFASSRIHNFAHLESIEVYTVHDNVNLVEIFHAMDKDGGGIPDVKDNGAIKKYFEKVYPEIDFERVYTSDLKKMLKWFEVLKKNEIEIKLSEPEEEVAEPKEAEVKEEKETASIKEQPKKKDTSKAEKPEATKKPAKKKTEDKPPKKSAAAKSAKSDKKAPKKKGK